MLTRLIAMLLLFSFGFSAMGECCMVCDEGHHEESTEHRSYESYKSYETYKSCKTYEPAQSQDQDHQQKTCDDNCAACLHTALTPSLQQTAVIGEQKISYPASSSSALLSRTLSIDRPPCWIA
jgi:hypothetical protein